MPLSTLDASIRLSDCHKPNLADMNGFLAVRSKGPLLSKTHFFCSNLTCFHLSKFILRQPQGALKRQVLFYLGVVLLSYKLLPVSLFYQSNVIGTYRGNNDIS